MAEIEEEDRKIPIPERFRASTDPEDARAYSRLLESDEQQKEWSLKVQTPISSQTPKERERANARILITTLENAAQTSELTVEQREQLAEAFAALGEYNRAAQTSTIPEKVEIFEKYWDAVWLDDEDWCVHPDVHKYIKEYIYSVKEDAEMPLLACNACGLWNVADAPEKLIEAQARRASVRQQTKGMDMPQVKRFLDNSGLRNKR